MVRRSLKMVKNTGSRVFHGVMVVPCAILCLISIISFSSFATVNDKIRRAVLNDDHYWDSRYCILFADSGGKDTDQYVLNDDKTTCIVAIWGEVSVTFLSLLLGLLFAVKALIGVTALSFFSIVELIVMILTGLLDFAMAIVISAGLDHTCEAFDDAAKKPSPSCRYELLFDGSDKGVSFYSNISASKITAWIGTVLLVVLAVIQFIVVFAYCRRLIHPENADQRLMPEDQEEDEESVAV